ncbi:MAG TPA: major capsid protein [Candidatus Ozemobacteraceae bacterium]|nr:major capsid protein [Candidatus Ozemobacteraceae bacterium]
MDTLFKSSVITAAINAMKAVKTPVLDKVFARKLPQLSPNFAWDIETSHERILRNLKTGEPAQVTKKLRRARVSCEAPRFAPKRSISGDDMAELRKFGDAALPELLANRINRELADMRNEIDRTREYMAVRSILGQVIDSEGTVLVDYSFSGAQKPVLTGKQLWTDSESNPLKNIRAWKKLIAKSVGGVDAFIAFCGSAAMDALIDNQKIQNLLQFQAGQQLAEKGRIAFLAETEIEEYFGYYKDSNGDAQDMIPENEFVLVGVSAETLAELYAPVIDFKDPAGVGKGQLASMFFAKSWEEEDPSVRWLKAESRPLPVLFRPECVVRARVVA